MGKRHSKWTKNTVYTNAPCHTEHVFTPEAFQLLVDDVGTKLQSLRKELNFDAIAGCGFSSIPLLGALSYTLGIPMICVRKAGEKGRACRGDGGVVGLAGASRYVIIDDLIDTGNTVTRVASLIAKKNPSAQPVAVILHHDKYCKVVELLGREVPVYSVA